MKSGASGFYWDSANPTPVIEFSLSAGALTVSTSGVCKVLLPKQGSPGLMQEIDLSGRSYTIASGAMIGRHGTTPSVAWGSAMPLFVYLVNSNNTAAGVQISLSRDPRASLTPTSEDNIGIAGSAAAVSAQGNHFQSGAAKLENVPCLCIGSLTATIDDSAGGVFTFGALSSTDGFGKFQEGVKFTFPLGQNGAESGKYTKSDGTDPSFSSQAFNYWQRADGSIKMRAVLTNTTGGTAGSGANYLLLACPLGAVTSESYTMFGMYQNGSTRTFSVYIASSGDPLITNYSYTTGANLVCNDLNDANNRRIYLTGELQAF